MTLNDIQDMARASRFAPFKIRLSEGRCLDVGHPEFLAIPAAGTRFVYFSGGSGLEVVNLNAVVSLQMDEPAASTADSGPAAE